VSFQYTEQLQVMKLLDQFLWKLSAYYGWISGDVISWLYFN